MKMCPETSDQEKQWIDTAEYNGEYAYPNITQGAPLWGLLSDDLPQHNAIAEDVGLLIAPAHSQQTHCGIHSLMWYCYDYLKLLSLLMSLSLSLVLSSSVIIMKTVIDLQVLQVIHAGKIAEPSARSCFRR